MAVFMSSDSTRAQYGPVKFPEGENIFRCLNIFYALDIFARTVEHHAGAEGGAGVDDVAEGEGVSAVQVEVAGGEGDVAEAVLVLDAVAELLVVDHLRKIYC